MKEIRRSKSRHFLVTLVLLLAVCAQVKADTALRLFFSDPWSPYIESGATDESCGGGVWIDLIDAIFAQVDGYYVVCGFKPWARVLEDARQGFSDGVILLGKTPERESYLEYVNYLSRQRVVVWYSAERFPEGLNWKTMSDFEGLQIGKIRKSINGREFEKAVDEGIPLNIYETTQELQLYKMILAGRIDVAAIPELVAINTIGKNGWSGKFKKMDKPMAENLIYFAFSKKSPARKLVPQINDIIRRMRMSGEIDRILGAVNK